MTQTELIIQDLKNQIARLSEERAIYFALSTHYERENTALKNELNQKGAEE